MDRSLHHAGQAPGADPVRRGVAPVLLEVVAQTCALVAPRSCPCGAEGTWLCGRCRNLLEAVPVRVESCCDALQHLSAARVLEEGPSSPAGVDHAPLLPVLALGEYAGNLQRLVLAWKNGGMLHLGGPIAAGLSIAVRHLTSRLPGGAPADQAYLVPVPSRWRARVRRGEDHTAELVRAMSRGGAGRPLLLRATPTTGQEGQGARQRRTRRIRLHSSVPGDLCGPGTRVIIVDDVVTTGSTLRGMHEALTDAGLQVIGAVVVASARVPSVRDPLSIVPASRCAGVGGTQDDPG